jgi:hypothetical protein
MAANIERLVEFIKRLQKSRDLEYYLSQHLRVSGVYWALTCLDLVDRLDELPSEVGIIVHTLCGNHKIYLVVGNHTIHPALSKLRRWIRRSFRTRISSFVYTKCSTDNMYT